MITYRTATQEDARRIAQLHALSWQQNYKGILTDDYLAHQVKSDRMQVWEKRLAQKNSNQYILLAFDGEVFCGFACSFMDRNPQWGALLDNLHVFGDWKGKGIGAELMKRSAKWVYETDPSSCFHLSVLEGNEKAIRFYKRMGGDIKETFMENLPGGSQANVHRFVWTDVASLSKR